MKKICIVATVSGFLKSFILEDLKVLSQVFDLTIICSDDTDFQKEFGINSTSKQIHIPRNIEFIDDIKALLLLTKYLQKNKFDIVLSATPKAGLLAMLGGFVCRVPRRVHFFTGQVWANKIGFKRFLLKSFDRLITKLTTNILVDGDGQRDFLIEQKVIKANNSTTMFHGLDTQKFQKNNTQRQQLRQQYSLNDDTIVLMFLGRINPDKGIVELLDVITELLKQVNNLACMIVGENENNSTASLSHKLRSFTKLKNAFVLSATQHPEQILNVADILLLPSHREGFGQVIIEAAAMGIPTICSDIYGLADSVIDEQTGLKHPVGDKQAMSSQYLRLINDNQLREKLGQNAQTRTVEKFSHSVVSEKLLKFLQGLS